MGISELSWECIRCREINEDEFDACWNCGASKEGVADPDFKSVIKLVYEPVCRKCGYSLFGLDQDRCPECGTPFDRQLPDTFVAKEEPSQWDVIMRRFFYGVFICVIIFFVLVVVLFVMLARTLPSLEGVH